jgi:hypothetical protein
MAGLAALFSITGFGRLFAGAMKPMMTLAGGLEFGKLVGISVLYRYWDELPKTLRSVLLVISVVIMGITSAGIYGYITAAYAKVAAVPLQMNAQVGILNSQIQSTETELSSRTTRLNQIISLRQQQENRIDTLIAKGLSPRTAQSQIGQLNNTANELQKEISNISTKRDSLKNKSMTTEVGIKTNSDIGTFIYVAEALGVSLDTVVKWFVLIIVLVFDPLSVCLIIVYNFLVKRNESNSSIATPIIPITKPDDIVLDESTIPDTPIPAPVYNDDPAWMSSQYDWDKHPDEWQNNPDALRFKKYLTDRGIL